MAAFVVRHVRSRRPCVCCSPRAEVWILAARQSCACLRDGLSVPDVVSNNREISGFSDQRKVGSRNIILLLLLMAQQVPSMFQ